MLPAPHCSGRSFDRLVFAAPRMNDERMAEQRSYGRYPPEDRASRRCLQEWLHPLQLRWGNRKPMHNELFEACTLELSAQLMWRFVP